jgi:hypothetical protein
LRETNPHKTKQKNLQPASLHKIYLNPDAG